jgi:hypothetical protein
MGALPPLRQYVQVVKKPLLFALAVVLPVIAGAAGPVAPIKKETSAKVAAPALPFRYIGRLVHNGKTELLLMHGERLYSIVAGGKVGDDYVVERIGDSSVVFTYVPLNLKQNLDLPGVN